MRTLKNISTPGERAPTTVENIRSALRGGDISEKDLQGVLATLEAERKAVRRKAQKATTGELDRGPTKHSRLIVRWEELREIMGGPDKGFFDPDFLKKERGIEIRPEDMPQLRITEIEAFNAKHLGHMISLHSHKLGNGKPSTMLELNDDEEERHKLKVLCDWQKWYRKSPFANTADKLKWRQNSMAPIGTSYGKNYLQQTVILVNYLKYEVLKGQQLSAQQEATIEEFEAMETELELLMTNWKQSHATVKLANGQPASNGYVAGKILANLKITRQTRPTPIGILNDMINAELAGIRMLRRGSTNTSAHRSGGSFIHIGDAHPIHGARVYSWSQYRGNSYIGAIFSRSLSGDS